MEKMFLKALEIFGFKSFADRVKLKFEEGITSIVGPNGCGKSNISDAIRWVLGEQNPAVLRGRDMRDLIFNGGGSRKPINMSEVSLIIGNSNGVLPIDLSEVVITRRLFRSGDSEYFINRKHCRLKDITQLFLDTGLGKCNYSLMHQGDVEFIINSKPEERRAIFEEAAGITKYRLRKEETLRRLNSTNQDLLRINDILREIQNQMYFLHHQAKRAQLFQHLKEKLREREFELIKIELGKKIRAIQLTKPKFEEFKGKTTNLRKELSRLREKIEKEEQRKELISGALSEVHQKMHQVDEQFGEVKSEVVRQEERRLSLSERMEWIEGEIENLKRKSEMAREQIRSEEKTHQDLIHKTKQTKHTLHLRENNLKNLKTEEREVEVNLQSAKEELIEQLRELANFRNRINSLREEELRLMMREEKLKKREEEIKLQQKKEQERIAALRKELSKVEGERQNLSKKLKESKSRRESVGRLLDEKRGKLNKLADETKAAQTKLNTLLELERTFAGHSRGVKLVLERKTLEDETFREVEGVVADLMEIPKKYEVAIEGALESSLQGIVVKTKNGARKIINYLEREGERATFLPIDTINSQNNIQVHREEGIIGRGIEVVRYEAKHKRAMEYLLGNVVIVEDLDFGEKLIKKFDTYIKVVTLKGDVIDSHMVMKGGKLKEEGVSPIGRKRKIRELREVVKDSNQNLRHLKQEIEDLEEELGEINSTLGEREGFLREKETLRSNLMVKLSIAEERISAYSRELSILDVEKEQIEVEKSKVGENLKVLIPKEKEMMEKNRDKETLISTLNKRLIKFRRRAESCSKAITKAKINLAKLTQREESSFLRRNALEDEYKAKQEEIEKLREEKAKIGRNLEELRISLEILERKILELNEKKSGFQNKLQKLQVENQLLSESLEAKLQEFTKKRERLDELKESFHKMEVERAGYQAEVENLVGILSKNYKLAEKEIKEIEDECIFTELDEAQILHDVEKLRMRIERMGEVNLMAQEEYKKLKERFSFTKTQRDDLLKASEDLKKMIEEMERTSKVLFEETFLRINKNFASIFQELFRGGKAKLKLIDEGGVEIEVQPPGKKLQNINLLSTGEKALTAIALLFAIFSEKPSPFCVLDEVDAALDDANTVRFCNLLREFAKKTQFLIITHNKKTIEISDALYGVTMEEGGVSKLVSVRLGS